ncbi:MAG: hypothetical protein M1814_004609 [Vezdaea aestivalis]|nr:MAG: hypothetical protein M1814_004609 [Vezdaea aestivalis]
MPRLAVMPSSPYESDSFPHKRSIWDRFKKFSATLLRDDSESYASSTQGDEIPTPAGPSRRLSMRVIPSLPRPGTFRRQQSERRDNLMPHDPDAYEHRSISVGRRRAASSARRRYPSPPPVAIPSLSAPEVGSVDDSYQQPSDISDGNLMLTTTNLADLSEEPQDMLSERLEKEETNLTGKTQDYTVDLEAELETKWILNLSMHFRDHSNREKFFITYFDDLSHHQKDSVWRRVTVSCDYREAEPKSLEADLKVTPYQREKSEKIYEAIQESLIDIKFYNTVTNLKLQTKEGRLHVHVTEDIPELIPYPSVNGIKHLACARYTESEVKFDSHLSGFVYKVSVEDQVFIKKEIPGPDAVEEFMYEINALDSLQGSSCVIPFGGVIVSDDGQVIKGLLLSFASQGALVDILYDCKGHLNWKRRERWAKQIVEGLSEIHECGFVQGDFTLSNIVVDDNDDAKIIDINRRGCPVGWEPPEVDALIHSQQRISMYIGVKSDLYQLGMVLWALAEEVDEPELRPRPLSLEHAGPSVPPYYRNLVSTCLSSRPQSRISAQALLARFPDLPNDAESRPALSGPPSPRYISPSAPEKQYIDPADAVEREDLERFRALHTPIPASDTGTLHHRSAGEATFAPPMTSATELSDLFDAPRGRQGIHRASLADSDISPDDTSRQPLPTQSQPAVEYIQDPASATTGSSGTCLDQISPGPVTIANKEEPRIMNVGPGDTNKWKEVEHDGASLLVRTPTVPDNVPADRIGDDEESVGGGIVLAGGTIGMDQLKLRQVMTPVSEDGGVLTGAGMSFDNEKIHEAECIPKTTELGPI